MRVIDVDAHFFEPFSWLESVDPELAADFDATLPLVTFADTVFGEVLNSMPEAQREEFRKVDLFSFLKNANDQVTPAEAEERIKGTPLESVFEAKGAYDGDARVAANLEQLIDLQFVNPTTAFAEYRRIYRHRRDRLADFCEAYNRWALATIGDHVDHLVPVALLDFDDPQRAVRELTRMREAEARACLLPLFPFDGKALSHPDFEPIWSAMEDLGIIATMHVGAGHAIFDPGWINTGRETTAEAGFRMSGTLAPQIVQAALTDLTVNGVFERHPDLVVLCSEFGLGWFRGWWERIGPTTHKVTVQTMIPWTWPLTAHEYIRRNVRVSPLPGDLVDRFIDDFGVEMLWFASDYPHPEGSANAVDEFRTQLAAYDDGVKNQFFGAGVEAFLARTA